LALYLCSDEAGFITGCDYPIDGGFIKLNNWEKVLRFWDTKMLRFLDLAN
jgi:hypothetical protein